MTKVKADEFFLSEAAALAGQADGAGELAERAAAELAAAGMRVEMAPCLERESRILHMGTLYHFGNGRFRYEELVSRAAQLGAGRRASCGAVLSGRRAAPGRDLLLPGQAEAEAELPPLVGRAFTLARCGDLVWGNWWLRSLGAEAFELASDFGLVLRSGTPPSSLLIEVWPVDSSLRRLACVGGRPHTTMVHLPFDGAARLRLIDAGPSSGACRRRDENLRGVFA